ncbi:MAG: hypothetical protein LBD91_05255 [Prevotellaceae bacterium]|jgi:hypothetical protein|nr:hypothetical protein [Prevotellaceae bacterium]
MFGLFFSLPPTQLYEHKRLVNETMYARLHDIKKSDEFKRYEELKEYVESPRYRKDLALVRSLSYRTSKERLVERRWKELRKYREVKKFRKKGEYSDAEYVREYLELDAKVNSPSFLQHKAYLKNPRRHLQSDPYLKFVEYRRLAKSKSVKQYFKIKKKYAAIFAEMERWTTIFNEEFLDPQLSHNWDTKPYWRPLMLEQNYASNREDHLVSDGDNINLQPGLAQIITRHETAAGVAWDEKIGFIPREFSYTSGMLSTAHKFQMKFGRLEAKIAFPNVKNVYHIFGLGSNRHTPAISVAHYCNRRLMMGAYMADKASSLLKKIWLYNNHFYIFQLERTTKSIKWYINGKKVFECRSQTSEPLYIAFASGVIGKTHDDKLPAAFEINYVKLQVTQ